MKRRAEEFNCPSVLCSKKAQLPYQQVDVHSWQKIQTHARHISDTNKNFLMEIHNIPEFDPIQAPPQQAKKKKKQSRIKAFNNLDCLEICTDVQTAEALFKRDRHVSHSKVSLQSGLR